MDIHCELEIMQVLPYIFMKEMDIKKIITKIDIYNRDTIFSERK